MQDDQNNEDEMRNPNFLDANNVQRQSIAPSFAPGAVAQQEQKLMSKKKAAVNKSQMYEGAGAVLNLDDINLRLSENVQLQNSIGKLRKAQQREDSPADMKAQMEENKCGYHATDFILFCLKC
jgi:hypothetical protein